MQRRLAIQDLCARLDRGTLTRVEFAERCGALIASTLGCSAAAIWLLPEGVAGCLIEPIARSRSGPRWGLSFQTACEAFAVSLESAGAVIAHEARAHAATAGLFDPALPASPVRSLLAVPFSVNGELHGAVVCAQFDRPLRWSAFQLNALRQLSGAISPALARATSFALSSRLADLAPPLWARRPQEAAGWLDPA